MSKIISEPCGFISIRNLFHSFTLFATMLHSIEMRCSTLKETQQSEKVVFFLFIPRSYPFLFYSVLLIKIKISMPNHYYYIRTKHTYILNSNNNNKSIILNFATFDGVRFDYITYFFFMWLHLKFPSLFIYIFYIYIVTSSSHFLNCSFQYYKKWFWCFNKMRLQFYLILFFHLILFFILPYWIHWILISIYRDHNCTRISRRKEKHYIHWFPAKISDKYQYLDYIAEHNQSKHIE